MKVKGICKDCKNRWQWGAKYQPQHLFCTLYSRIIKNTALKECKDYELASPSVLSSIKWRCNVPERKPK